MALLVPDVGKVEILRRILFGRGGVITGATNATPLVVTSVAHGLSNGNAIIITDVGGNTNANGTWIVGNVATDTFRLFPTSSGTGGTAVNGNGAYTSGGSWSLAGMETLTLKTYQNNKTPAETDTAASYTESTYTGYAAKSLVSQQAVAAWTVPASITPTGAWAPGSQTLVAEATFAAQAFSPLSSQSIYGMLIVGANSTVLTWAELFSAVRNVVSGDTVTVTVRQGCANAA